MRACLRCVDDRGRPWRFEDGALERAIRARDAADPAAAAALRPVRSARALGMLAITLGVLALMGIGAWLEAGTHGAATWALGFAAAAIAIITASVVQRFLSAWAQRSAAARLGVCPSCTHGLTQLRPEADGCHVCPECGSAWRMDGSAVGSAS